MCHIFIIYFSVNEQICWFHFLELVNRIADRGGCGKKKPAMNSCGSTK